MDNLPFYHLSNIDLCDELNNINCLDNLHLLDTYTGIYSNINILADKDQLLLKSNKQASCKYYTINDYKAHIQIIWRYINVFLTE